MREDAGHWPVVVQLKGVHLGRIQESGKVWLRIGCLSAADDGVSSVVDYPAVFQAGMNRTGIDGDSGLPWVWWRTPVV